MVLLIALLVNIVLTGQFSWTSPTVLTVFAGIILVVWSLKQTS
ncbi:hypothetical protein [Deinococcus pimensis]|nr:hypothetical protein [Deinococcus pimensis]